MNTSARITLGLLFGAAGGFLGWFVIDPVLHLVHDIEIGAGAAQPVDSAGSDLLFWAVFSLFTAVGLALADALRSGTWGRFKRDAGVGVGVGVAAGVVGGQLGNAFFALALGGRGLAETYAAMAAGDMTAMPRLVVGRAIGFTLIGGLLGLSGGLARGSSRKMKLGVLGGLVGGLAGGLFFELIGQALGGMVSRMVSLTLIGGTIGAAIALVEDLLKQAWVTVLVGRNEGRETILMNEISTLGRDELSDVGLFGDLNVAPRHAVIRREANGYTLAAEPGAAVALNGTPISRQGLRDGDRIQIGGVAIEFHEKASRSSIRPPVAALDDAVPALPPMPGNLCPYCGEAKDSVTGACACSVPPTGQGAAGMISTAPARGISRLTALSGPLSGQAIALGGAPVRIGREEGREIRLPADSTVSRRHAVVQADAGEFVLSDEGSSNGTFVNGSRVTRQALRVGDEIRVGESRFRVE